MSNNTEPTTFTGWAATSAGAPLERFSYDPARWEMKKSKSPWSTAASVTPTSR